MVTKQLKSSTRSCTAFTAKAKIPRAARVYLRDAVLSLDTFVKMSGEEALHDKDANLDQSLSRRQRR